MLQPFLLLTTIRRCATRWVCCCAPVGCRWKPSPTPPIFSCQRRPATGLHRAGRANARISGLDLQKQLRTQGYRLPIIFMTGHGDVPMAIRAMKAGAFDFIEKPFQGEILRQRIEDALQVDNHKRRRQARRTDAATRLALLSPREREVLDRVAAGQYNKVIAAELGISLSTVEIHRKRVMEKLQAGSLSDLIRMLALLNDTD